MTLVNAETGEVLEPMSKAEAEELTHGIKANLLATWDLITEAYQRQAWTALGYDSWDDYCRTEFGSSRIKLPSEERREVVTSLRDAGLSIRAISAATGAATNTVRRDLQVSQSDTPQASRLGTPDLRREQVEPIPKGAKTKGTDGKTYAKTTTRKSEFTTTEKQGPVGQEAVDLATERTARSDAAYRENLSKTRVKALALTQFDPERCAAVLPPEDKDGELRLIERMQGWLDAYRSALTDTRLRSVK